MLTDTFARSSDSTIVKVFGFPPEMKPAIIEYFSQLGHIEERFQSVSNWMTFRYSSPHSAKRALESHGHILQNTCMVGVVVANTMAG